MKIPSFLLAPVVILSFFGVVVAANLWELPTQQSQFKEASANNREIQIIVNGLFCRGTSNFFMSMLSGAPGLVTVKTYVQEHRAVIVFNPTKISVPQIRQIIESPVRLRDGRIVQPFEVREVRQ